MKSRHSVFLSMLLILWTALPATRAFSDSSPCSDDATGSGWRIYYHNSGEHADCIQDLDLDVPEFDLFRSEFAAYLAATPGEPVIGDNFNASCEPPRRAHGLIVDEYFLFASNDVAEPTCVEKANFPYWWDMVDHIAHTYINTGTIANLSNGTPGWDKNSNAPVELAYNNGILLIGAPLTFRGCPEDLRDKVLRCSPAGADGAICQDLPQATNTAVINVPTNWYDSSLGDFFLAVKARNPDWANAYCEEGPSGSFSTGMLSGFVQYIGDIVYSRGYQDGAFVDQVLDYVISSCDRTLDAETYEHRSHPVIYSFGPWSDTRGYGYFSPWKAMIYAYGFGRLEARDFALDGNPNPPTVFSDHFFLRGDLYVPAGQSFIVSPLATASIDPVVSTPEGSSSLGIMAGLPEIHVAGVMDVETSILNQKATPKKGVNTTVTASPGGEINVKDGGTITVSAGQFLYVLEGGELNLETGGEIIVENGGMMMIFGQFNHHGTLTLESGSQAVFGPTSTVYLGADLIVPEGATVMFSPGSVTTVASTDACGTGMDTERVEINCSGIVSAMGNSNAHVTIEGEIAGAGEWVGISINSTCAGQNYFYCTDISDAETGLDIGGSTAVSPSTLTLTDCVTGVRVSGRSDVTLTGYSPVGGEISDCTVGVELDQADITISEMAIHNNCTGIRCTSSSPTVRNCDIYSNGIGVMTHNSSSIPDLGTVADAGNNDFYGPGPGYPGTANDIHILAADPETDIHAQLNWWGTVKAANIAARIVVADEEPWGCGTVIFEPFLTGAPSCSPAFEPDTDTDDEEVVSAAYLAPNYPNPFNPSTAISFGLVKASPVNLSIFDASGRLVRVLADRSFGAGHHTLTWNGVDERGNAVASGVYFYRLDAGDFRETKKMILLR